MISFFTSQMNFIKNNHFVLVVQPQVFVKSCTQNLLLEQWDWCMHITCWNESQTSQYIALLEGQMIFLVNALSSIKENLFKFIPRFVTRYFREKELDTLILMCWDNSSQTLILSIRRSHVALLQNSNSNSLFAKEMSQSSNGKLG